ncbi:Collagen alpha-1(XXI) chain [Takifugu flavidus]|uniref:Collagen alpha-1(XXI) chain n=1 Tax=Takifugu flavidus TaxID=433684 RepID=A0A5C6NX79_9TELE|nr:Collagen alpha-1(XXI) chain [Takifugu flavidus]
MLLWFLSGVVLLLIPLEAADEDDVKAGCSTVVNDLVYVVDGSWSVGVSDFDSAKQWLINITSQFDISSAYTQVKSTPACRWVWSSTAMPLAWRSRWGNIREKAISSEPSGASATWEGTRRQDSVQMFTRLLFLKGKFFRFSAVFSKPLFTLILTGRAIRFAVDHVFPSTQRAGQVKNRIAVVLTDGKSQDDVVDASTEARAEGITVFAVGVGSEITTSELISIANKPSSTYVLYAEDYTTIHRIRESMGQKLCEESVCPTRIPVSSRDEKGFELMIGMKLQLKAKKIPGSLSSETAYALSATSDITENTREIFPEGLPPSYVFVATLRIKASSSKLTFDLWRVLSKDKEIQAAVTLNGKDKSVIFVATRARDKLQRVVFQGFQDLFDGKWHQLKLLVRPPQLSSFLDDRLIREGSLDPVDPIYINGKTQLSKRPGTDTSVPVDLQKLRLYCDPLQSQRETACEIFSVEDDRCPANRTAPVEDCVAGPPGQRGPPGRTVALTHMHFFFYDMMVFVGREGGKDPRDQMANLVKMDRLEKQDLWAQLGWRENVVQRDPEESLVPKVIRDNRDYQENQEHQDHQGPGATLERKVTQDLQDKLEPRSSRQGFPDEERARSPSAAPQEQIQHRRRLIVLNNAAELHYCVLLLGDGPAGGGAGVHPSDCLMLLLLSQQAFGESVSNAAVWEFDFYVQTKE